MWSFVSASIQRSGVQPGCIVCQFFILLYCQITFQCMHGPPFVYPFSSWWTFQLFPLFGLLWIMLLWKFVYKFFCVCMYFHTWVYTRDSIAGSYGNCLIYQELQDCFPNWLYHVAFPTTCMRSDSSTSLPTLVINCFISVLVSMKWCSSFVCIYLMTNDIEHLYMCLSTISVSSLETYPDPLPIFKQNTCSFINKMCEFFIYFT